MGAMLWLEWVRAARRPSTHWVRWFYAAWLALQLVALAAAAADAVGLGRQALPSNIAGTARDFVTHAVNQHFLLLTMLTPALVAGTVTEEKTRGTLEPLLTTELTPVTILAGKWLARALQVTLVGLTVVPALALTGPFGGVTPIYLALVAALTAGLAVGLGAVGLLASALSRSTRDAVIFTYVLILVTLVAPIYGAPWSASALAPTHVLAPAEDEPDWAELQSRSREFAAAWAAIALTSFTLAAWRLRPAFLRQQQSRNLWAWLNRFQFRPLPGESALKWKEAHVGRLPAWLGVFACGVATALSLPPMVPSYPAIEELIAYFLWTVLFAATVWAGVRASSSVTAERERRTWDCVLTTPIDTPDIIAEKMAGVCRGVWPFVYAALIPGLFVTAVDQAPIEVVAALTVAGLAMAGLLLWTGWPLAPEALAGPTILLAGASGPTAAIVVAVGLILIGVSMNFLASVGLWSSARMNSSWKSLVVTLALGSVSWSMVSCVSFPLMCLSLCIFSILVFALNDMAQRGLTLAPLLPAMMGVSCILAFAWAGRKLAEAAALRLARYDRIVEGKMRYIDMDIPFKMRGAMPADWKPR